MQAHDQERPTHLITVLAFDRVGIVAAVSGALSRAYANLLELSQTVVCDYFTMIVAARLPPSVDAQALAAEIRATLGGTDTHVHIVQRAAGPKAHADSQPFIVTATGGDQPGLVHTITQVVADRGGDFSDISCRVRDGRFTLVAEVSLPTSTSVPQLQIDLEHAGAAVGLSVRLQHQRLFAATNEISFRA